MSHLEDQRQRWCTPRPAPSAGSLHTCSAYHRDLVDSYRVARVAAEQTREDVTRGHATELREHPPIITFRAWLEQTRQNQDGDQDDQDDVRADRNDQDGQDDDSDLDDGWFL